jgi:hypothetical protein
MFYVVLLIAVAIVAFAGRVMWHGLQTAPRPAMTDDVRRARHRLQTAVRRMRRSDRSAGWDFGNVSPNRG